MPGTTDIEWGESEVDSEHCVRKTCGVATTRPPFRLTRQYGVSILYSLQMGCEWLRGRLVDWGV